MSNRDAFIQVVKEIFDRPELFVNEHSSETWTKANEFWNEFLNEKIKSSNGITENGIKILVWMQENKEALSNVFTSREIAEGLFVSGRSVSGAMRKLTTDGFVQKIGQNPVQYALTEQGNHFSNK